jgi:hypothetical protein
MLKSQWKLRLDPMAEPPPSPGHGRFPGIGLQRLLCAAMGGREGLDPPRPANRVSLNVGLGSNPCLKEGPVFGLQLLQDLDDVGELRGQLLLPLTQTNPLSNFAALRVLRPVA